ncbi:hypothetical protein P5705_18945 [Pseudomonas entomophila]|uniref:hypothetical protein n=1 Tax=Pseudomonas entomophila TaxID=312306 RepID=UPI002406DAFF|nr:hypothetical protein [Pseudomonas entomophila]MDF9619729.1 hypothetical protein [Pseudomonas entomophila]
MSTIKERVERSLAALDAGRPLAALVEEIQWQQQLAYLQWLEAFRDTDQVDAPG